LRHDLELSKNGELGEVGFGLGPMVAAVFMADTLTELINKYPRMKVRAYVNNADQLHDSLVGEHIDFFIHSSGLLADDPRIAVAFLGELPLSLFVRRGHPLTGKKHLKQGDLSAFPFISGNAPKFTQSAVSIAGNPQQPNSFRCDDQLTLKQVVQRTDAIFIASRAMLEEECRLGKIVEIGPAQTAAFFSANLVVTSLAGRNLSPSAALVVQIIRDQYKRVRSSLRPK
jgi:DNA-binding transcriptional LysR family regulator